MKKNIYLTLALVGVLSVASCNDDDWNPGNPGMDVNMEQADALFGDSLPFTVKASDLEVPLSTLKAQLYYGDEKVSETVIRTKTSGEDYTGKIYVPFLPSIANGKATLKYVLQNIHFTTTEQEQEITLARPDFPYLTLVTDEGTEYKMERTALYQYNVTNEFPQKLKAYIKTPKTGENGNELRFGWDNDNKIAVGGDNTISFSNTEPGAYEVKFNVYSYEASPFVKLKVNGEEMDMVDANTYTMDLSLKKNDLLEFVGVPGYDNWYIDPDYFSKEADGKLKFLPMDGSYRITADLKYQYFKVIALKGNEAATLQNDGTGAIWVLGNGIGKPSVGANEVGWNPGKGLCMSQISAKKYQVTVVAGKTLKADKIDFKFFYQDGWGDEYTHTDITTNSDLVGIGVGGDDLPGDGNLYLLDGKSFELGGIYRFTVDVTGGVKKAVLSIEKIGVEELPKVDVSIDGVKMDQVDPDTYRMQKSFTQGQTIAVAGIDDIDSWWINPDFFSKESGNTFKFLPMDGEYRIVADMAMKYFAVTRMNGNTVATLGDDGHGAVWLMGWGVGSPSLDHQFGWNTGNNYCMPEISPKVYRLTAIAGPEKGSSMGQRIRFDYLSCKFFFQDGYKDGGEFSGANALTIAPGSEAYIADKGNIELADEVKLEVGVTYVMTVDLTAGNDKGVISFVKK